MRLSGRHFLLGIAGLAMSSLGCAEAPLPLGDAERSAIGDSILALATSSDGAVDRLDCATGVEIFGDREPIFVGGGRVMRSRAELEPMCEQMITGRTGATYELTSSDVHVLSRDIAYLVREGTYTIEYTESEPNINTLVITGIWERGEAGWKRVHFHESWPEVSGG